MVAWLRIGVAVSVAAVVGACAQLPSAENVTAFANATTKVADVLKSAIDVNTDLAQRDTEEERALVYISGIRRCAFLASASPQPNPSEPDITKCPAEPADQDVRERTGKIRPEFQLPPVSDKAISEKALQPRRKLVEALSQYAKGLSAAASQGDVQALEAASVTLASTVSTAISPLLGPTAPIIGPLAKLAGRGLGLAIGNAYAIEVGRIIKETDPFVQQAVSELKSSIAIVNTHNEVLLKGWLATKWANLQLIQKQVLVSRSDAYKDYRAAVAEGAELKAKVEALKNFGQILDGLGKAHAALAKGGVDGDAALTRFIDLTGNLSDLLPLLKPSK